MQSENYHCPLLDKLACGDWDPWGNLVEFLFITCTLFGVLTEAGRHFLNRSYCVLQHKQETA